MFFVHPQFHDCFSTVWYTEVPAIPAVIIEHVGGIRFVHSGWVLLGYHVVR